MIKFIYILLATLVLSSCNQREEIPPEVLSLIIEDTILTTAVVDGIPSIRDSVNKMDFYSPVLKSHGYTLEDMEYTITKMISRKTAVLNNVLDDARESIDNKKLSAEQIYKLYSDFNKKIDELYIDTIYKMVQDIHFTKKSDINKITYYFPLEGAGDYKIRIYYTAENLPNNTHYYANFKLRDSLVKSYNDTNTSRRYLYHPRKKEKTYNAHIEFRWILNQKKMANIAELGLFSKKLQDTYSSQPRKTKKENLKIDLTIDSVFLIKTPYYEEIINKLLEQQYGYKSIGGYIDEVVTIKAPYQLDALDTTNIIERYLPIRCQLTQYITKKELEKYYPIVVDSTTVDSTTVDSITVDSTTVDSITVDSTTVDSTTVDSTNVDSITVDSTEIIKTDSLINKLK